MHCDVIQPALPIAGFLMVFGLVVLADQRRAPRSRARLCLGLGSLLVAVLATTSVPKVGCDAPPPTGTPRSAVGVSSTPSLGPPEAFQAAAPDRGGVA